MTSHIINHETKSQPSTAMPPDYSESQLVHENIKADLVPLKDLARWPRVVDCPACHNVAATRIVYRIGTGTQYA